MYKSQHVFWMQTYLELLFEHNLYLIIAYLFTFYSVILGFNYSTSNMSADHWCHLNSLRINHVLHQSSPLHKMLIPKIFDDAVFLLCELLYHFAVSYTRMKNI